MEANNVHYRKQNLSYQVFHFRALQQIRIFLNIISFHMCKCLFFVFYTELIFHIVEGVSDQSGVTLHMTHERSICFFCVYNI